MTPHERMFFEKLAEACAAFGEVGVFPQVAMNAILDARPGLNFSQRTSIRNTFDRKIVDFVIVDSTLKILAIVELDDRTHLGARNRDRDRQRDRMTAAAGYKTIRFMNGAGLELSQIQDRLAPLFSMEAPDQPEVTRRHR